MPRHELGGRQLVEGGRDVRAAPSCVQSGESTTGGAIPHSISAGSSVFPAETATKVLASAGLPTFSPPSQALPLSDPAVEAEWVPQFPDTSSMAANQAPQPPVSVAQAPINMLL